MKMRIIVIFLSLLFIPFSLFGEDILVTYSDGLVEYFVDGSWYEAFIGDQIPASTQIRLSEDSFAELAGNSTTVQISKSGIYDLGNLFQSSQVATGTIGRGGRISRLVSNRPPDASTSVTGGVRASEAVDRDQTAWAGDADAMELIRDGIDMLSAEDYQSAYWFFEEAYDSAQDTEEAMVGFYFGFSAALVGKTAEALGVLERYPVDPSTPYYADHVLTLAQIYIQTVSYEDAVSLLEAYLSITSEPAELRQEAQLMRGVALQALGNLDGARSAFSESVNLVPDSPIAETAQEFLNQL